MDEFLQEPMPREELIDRMAHYKRPSGPVDPASWGVSEILEIAGVYRQQWDAFVAGKGNLGPSRMRRLTRALIQAETGCISKKRGIIYVGPPTKPLPPRVTLTLTNLGPRLAPAAQPQRSVVGLPSFKSVLGGVRS